MTTTSSVKPRVTSCLTEGCDRPVHANGLCNACNVRFHKRRKTYAGIPKEVLFAEVIAELPPRGRPRTPYSADAVRKALTRQSGGWNPKLSRERVFASRDFGPVSSTLPWVASQSRYGKNVAKTYCNIRQAKKDREEAGRLQDVLGTDAVNITVRPGNVAQVDWGQTSTELPRPKALPPDWHAKIS